MINEQNIIFVVTCLNYRIELMPKDMKSLEHLVTYFGATGALDKDLMKVVPFHQKTDVTALQEISVIGFDETIKTDTKKFSMECYVYGNELSSAVYKTTHSDAFNYVVSITQSISEAEPALQGHSLNYYHYDSAHRPPYMSLSPSDRSLLSDLDEAIEEIFPAQRTYRKQND